MLACFLSNKKSLLVGVAICRAEINPNGPPRDMTEEGLIKTRHMPACMANHVAGHPSF
jgi:hypothetical protein